MAEEAANARKWEHHSAGCSVAGARVFHLQIDVFAVRREKSRGGSTTGSRAGESSAHFWLRFRRVGSSQTPQCADKHHSYLSSVHPQDQGQRLLEQLHDRRHAHLPTQRDAVPSRLHHHQHWQVVDVHLRRQLSWSHCHEPISLQFLGRLSHHVAR